MKKKVEPSEVKGNVDAPPSKSFAQRAVAIAIMAQGQSEILYPGSSDDVIAAINVGRLFGAEITEVNSQLVIGGGIKLPGKPLDCGEAGLSIRMLSGIASVFNHPVILTGRGSLQKRPMNAVDESLSALGVKCTTDRGYLPITIQGPVRGGVAEIDGSFSSQILTGILIASPYSESDLTLKVKNLKSRPYIDMTLSVMKSFGVEVENRDYSLFFVRSGQRYHPARYIVEGDWSGASFLLVAGALGGRVTVNNLDINSVQADKMVIEALKGAGAVVTFDKSSVTVTGHELKGFEFDATHCPDLFPPLVSLAAYSAGISRIAGVERLIYKESNRAETLRDEFGKLGVKISIKGDVMEIEGGGCSGGLVSSHGDHRIAMACAVAGLRASGAVEIEGAEAVAKSYPDFFGDIEKLTKQV